MGAGKTSHGNIVGKVLAARSIYASEQPRVGRGPSPQELRRRGVGVTQMDQHGPRLDWWRALKARLSNPTVPSLICGLAWIGLAHARGEWQSKRLPQRAILLGERSSWIESKFPILVICTPLHLNSATELVRASVR